MATRGVVLRRGGCWGGLLRQFVATVLAARLGRGRLRGGLLEVPVTTARFFNRNWPASGGGYFRLMPYALSSWLLRQVNQNDGQPVVFYFHPWEIDIDQPRIEGINARTRFRHYVNLHRTEARIRRLLRDFSWARMDEIFLPDGVAR